MWRRSTEVELLLYPTAKARRGLSSLKRGFSRTCGPFGWTPASVGYDCRGEKWPSNSINLLCTKISPNHRSSIRKGKDGKGQSVGKGSACFDTRKVKIVQSLTPIMSRTAERTHSPFYGLGITPSSHRMGVQMQDQAQVKHGGKWHRGSNLAVVSSNLKTCK